MNNVIVAFARTPIGSFMGSLSSVTASKLGAVAIKGAVEKCNIDVNIIDQVILGNVLPAGLGQAPARQSAIYAGLPNSVDCLTINKMCGSGLQSVMLADQIISNDSGKVIIAGGMESMSQSPHYLSNSRSGIRLGEGKLIDGMIVDGLWDVYSNKHMGSCAEMCAEKFNILREEQDNFAIESYEKSQDSIRRGIFSEEIVPVEIIKKKETIFINEDEEPTRVSFEKIKKLNTVFKKDGSITAGNASTINDGAAVCLIMSSKKADTLGFKPIVEIVNHSSYSHDPEWFTTAPVSSINKLLNDSDIKINDIDLFEINEAFSVVTLAAIKNLKLDKSKVNIFGGAVSMGHPIGASGCRILCTLINGLNKKKKNLGLASICIGGGEASSMILRRCNS